MCVYQAFIRFYPIFSNLLNMKKCNSLVVGKVVLIFLYIPFDVFIQWHHKQRDERVYLFSFDMNKHDQQSKQYVLIAVQAVSVSFFLPSNLDGGQGCSKS